MLVLISACSADDSQNYHYDVLPFESVTMPSTFTLGERYTIDFTYKRPTTCHSHNGVLLNSEGATRTFVVSNYVANMSNCTPVPDQDAIVAKTFEFVVLHQQTYTFKFWKGKNDQGVDVYETIEVPVTD